MIEDRYRTMGAGEIADLLDKNELEGRDYFNCVYRAMSLLREQAQTEAAKPVVPVKDHVIAQTVNELRDMAIQFRDAQQLQERIAHVIVPLLSAAPTPPVAQGVAEHQELKRLRKLINTPELHDFAKGVVLEAAHQREKWGAANEAGKTNEDWRNLLGYLSQKVLDYLAAGNLEKAIHHTITTAAACANWHAALSGSSTSMRPGFADADAALPNHFAAPTPPETAKE